MTSVTFEELSHEDDPPTQESPEEDALSTHEYSNLLKFINYYKDSRHASTVQDEPTRKSPAPPGFLRALINIFYYDDDDYLGIKNNILACLKDSSIKGARLVKQVEKSQHLLGLRRLQDGSLELYNALQRFLSDTTIIASNRLEPTRYEVLDEHLGLVPRKCSQEAVLICARFQGMKWCVNKNLTRELLLIEQSLRKSVLEVLTAALLKYRRPRYPILLKRAKAIQLQMETVIKSWEGRLEIAASRAKADLSRVGEGGGVQMAQDASATPSPKWFAAFNAAFNEYERTLKSSGVLHRTK